MRQFLIFIRYTAPISDIELHTASHRAFLQEGYDSGMLLMSGPLVPRTGGVLIARADSPEQVMAFLARDPFTLAGVVSHELIEFKPVKSQAFVADWIAGN
jgi:uncharacterized protein YciI